MDIIFINDLVDSCEYNLKSFADDAKMYRHIKDVSDIDNLQRGINKCYFSDIEAIEACIHLHHVM